MEEACTSSKGQLAGTDLHSSQPRSSGEVVGDKRSSF